MQDQTNNDGLLVRAGGRGALSRRGFLLRVGAAGALFAAGGALAAGCGGGSDDDDDDDFDEGRYEGTYRFFSENGGPSNGEIAASFTVDRDGRMTFWTRVRGDDPFLDFGQVFVDEDGFFDQEIDGVRTRGEVDGNRIRGRTEEIGGDYRYDFNAVLQPRRVNTLPPLWFTGTFAGRPVIDDVEFYTLLGVSRDGNATVFGAFDDVRSGDLDYYYFEGTSFNVDGNVGRDDDYFLFQFGDRLELRDIGPDDDVRLTYIFGADASEIGVVSGERVDVRLSPNLFGRGVVAPVTRSMSNGTALPRGKAGAKAMASRGAGVRVK